MVRPVNLGEIVWGCLYSDLEDDFLKLPLNVIKVYEDGSWDGELYWAEA